MHQPPPRPLRHRAAARLRRHWQQAHREILAKAATLRARRALEARSPAPEHAEPLADLVRMVISHRVTSPARMRIVEVVGARLGASLRDDPPSLTVRDASQEPFRTQSERVWRSLRFPLEYTAVDEPQLTSFRAIAASAVEPFLALQFDDTLTAGITPTYLRAAVELLERFSGTVDLVCPVWSLDVGLVPDERIVRVLSHRRWRQLYGFDGSRPRRPLRVELVRGLRFGIFENPTYGFFFNHAVVPRVDYARRVEWYAAHVSDTSVHAVELAAQHGTLGPAWRHAAICLDGVSLLDLDYAHTSAAVRSERPDLRAIVEALAEGWRVEVVDQEGRVSSNRPHA